MICCMFIKYWLAPLMRLILNCFQYHDCFIEILHKMYLDTLNQNIQLQVSSQKEIAVDLRNFYCIFTRDRILVSKGG